MAEGTFWEDAAKAQKMVDEASAIRLWLTPYRQIQRQVEDVAAHRPRRQSARRVPLDVHRVLAGTVEATGRRRAARPRTADLWLPAADGTVRAVVGSDLGPSSDRRPDQGSDVTDRRPSLRVVGGAASNAPTAPDRRRAG